MRQELIDKIAKLMKEKEMSILQLSKISGISRPTVTNLVQFGHGKMLTIEKVLEVLENKGVR